MPEAGCYKPAHPDGDADDDDGNGGDNGEGEGAIRTDGRVAQRESTTLTW